MSQQIVAEPEFVANPDYTGKANVFIDKLYCDQTGIPLVSIQVVMPDGQSSPMYSFDVPTAEKIAEALWQFAGEHRQKHPPEWFEET